MTSHTTRTISTATATIGLLLASIGAASAETLHVEDASGDVVRLADDSGGAEALPGRVDGDITRTRLWHAHKVGVVVHFADLKRVGDQRMDLLEIATNEGLHRHVIVSAESKRWAGTASLFKPNEDQVTCGGLTHKIDYKANTVTIRVPRSCLSSPRWVKMGFGSSVITEADNGSVSATVDDALRHDPYSTDDSDPVMSPRIHLAK